MQYCKFLILCEYLIPLFCIKARQYKIMITNFLLLFPTVQNRLKHKIEILISVRVAFHDFMLKLIPCVWLGIYSNKMTLHVSWWSFKFFYNLLSEPTSFLSFECSLIQWREKPYVLTVSNIMKKKFADFRCSKNTNWKRTAKIALSQTAHNLSKSMKINCN